MGRLAMISLAAVVAVGCAKISFEDDESAYEGPVNSCSGDVDCPVGECRETLGLCAVQYSQGSEDELYVKVIPDATTGAPYQVFEVDVRDDGNVATLLDVKVPVVLVGSTLAGETAPSYLQATIVFTDVGNRLPGHPARLTLYESDGAVFDTSLLPGKYSIMVIPSGTQADTFPVYYMDDVTVETSGVLYDSGGSPSGIIVPRPVADSDVRGIIRQGGLPTNGLEVMAVDPETGRIVSTIAETECNGDGPYAPCGWFKLRMAPGTTAFDLMISRNYEPHHPVVTLTGFEAPAEGETLDLTSDERLSLDPLSVPVRYQATVERPVNGVGEEIYVDPAPGCFVLFESDDVAGGVVEKWVSTNENGTIEEISGVEGVNLYPGDYLVTVVPAQVPEDSTVDYASLTLPDPVTISGAAQIGGQLLSLSFRPRLTGVVLAGEEPVPGCYLSAEPVALSPPSSRSSAATTTDDGEFSIWLDEATYQIQAEAPAKSRYAWGSRRLTISGEGVSAIDLSTPFVATGTVIASSDQSEPIDLGGAVVEWYRVIDGQAFAIGKTVADSKGDFTALLPPAQ